MKTYTQQQNQIIQIKESPQRLESYIKSSNESNLQFVLEKLGRLNSDEFKEPLLKLLDHNNDKIRALALKNLAKLNDISLLNTFIKYATNDTSTKTRRESVSAIGRLRNPSTIPILIELLNDEDPKVVMQSIRGLLVFSSNIKVKNELKKLTNHPNEIIQEVIKKEFQSIPKKISGHNSQKHTEHLPYLSNIVVNADVLEVLRYVPEDSIHLTFTSPPYYNARDYSIYQSYEDYLNFLEKVFGEIYRVTKEGRFFVLNTSPIIIPRISRAHSSKRYPIPFDLHGRLMKMGWEFIDDIIWAKPEASVKNRNAGFLQHRKPLGYKPNSRTEMIMVYRKKTDKLIDWNIHQYSNDIVQKSKVLDEYETSNIWFIDPKFDKIHSAVFPIELCNRVVKFYSYVGDLVFDPFAGSGTLGRSALLNHRKFFLTEINADYIGRIKEEFSKISNPIFDKNSNAKILSIAEFKSLKHTYDNNRTGSKEYN